MMFETITDKTGFPLIRHESWNFFISLFPVSKYQFERFLAHQSPDGEQFTDRWYRRILEKNPRCAWHDYRDRPWNLFLSGLPPRDLDDFFGYMGQEFSLPSAEQWNLLYQMEKEIIRRRNELIEECRKAESPHPVICWLEQGLFPLASEGMVEWIRDKQEFACIGRPFYQLFPSLWDPGTVHQVLGPELENITGFRLVMECMSAFAGGRHGE